MGNPYSYTSNIIDQGPGWSNLLPPKWIAIAGAAVVQTAQLGVKVAVTPVTSLVSSVNKSVPRYISQTSNERAKQIQIYATWLKEGALSGPVSAITGTLTGAPLTHWFALIITDNANVFYWAELNNNGVRLIRCNSKDEVLRNGCSSGSNSDAENFTIKMSKSCNCSMSSIKTWVENSSNHYHLNWHNCQHWAEKLYNWI